jgi:hypothetical protein
VTGSARGGTRDRSAQAVVDRLETMSPEVRASLLLDAAGEVAAHAGAGESDVLGVAARDLLAAADLAAGRTAMSSARRIEVSSPLGGVFAVRAGSPAGEGRTLVAVTAPGALPALVLYDMRMALSA